MNNLILFDAPLRNGGALAFISGLLCVLPRSRCRTASMQLSLTAKQQRLLDEAIAFVSAGQFEHALNCVAGLPVEQQRHPDALMVQLLGGIALKRWPEGQQAAELFAAADQPERRVLAGKFYLEYARELSLSGEQTEAWAQMRKLFVCWPDGREQVIQDPDFSRLFE